MLNLKDMLPDAVKSALFTDDATTPAAPASTPHLPNVTGTLVADPPLNHAAVAPPISNSSAPSNDILAGTDADSLARFTSLLHSRTDFDSTSIGVQLQEHLAPLAGLPLTDEQKIATAVKAGAKDGLTGDAILQAYDQLLATLKDEQRQFDRSVAATTKTEVEDCKAAITAEAATIKDLEAQITAARERQSTMSTDMIAAQVRIDQRKAQFAAAFATRQAELQSAITRYQFLKGSTAHVDQPIHA